MRDFIIGFVPTLCGGALLACAYALSSGLAGVIGLGAGASTAAAVVGTVAALVPAIATTATLMDILTSPAFKSADSTSYKSRTAGAVAGLAASIGLGYAMSAEPASAPQKSASAAFEQTVVKQAANTEAPQVRYTAPAPKLTA